MTNSRFRYLLICFSFLSCLLYAEEGKLTFSHYTNDDGLPSSYIKSISQDDLGFIWTATRGAVCRFDGTHFTVCRVLNNEGVPFDIWGMAFYRYNDSLLIVKDSENKCYNYNYVLECFEPYNLINNIENVTTVYEAKQGFWIGTKDSLLFLNVVDNTIISWQEHLNVSGMSDNTTFVGLKENEKYFVGVTGDNKLLVVDEEQGDSRVIDLPEELRTKIYSAICIDRYNQVWLGIVDNGMWRINLANGEKIRFSVKSEGNHHLLHDLVHAIAEDHQGRIWIGTENGLCVWSPYTETFEYYQYDMDTPEGLNSNPIYDLFCDKDGNMWGGTYFGGINFWGNNSVFFKVWNAGASKRHISGNAVSCITEDDAGNIWVGMEDMGVNRIDAQSGLITYKINTDNGLSFNNVHHIFFENKDKMWISTYTGGINIYDLKTKRFQYINKKNAPDLPSNNIYHILQAGDTLFISTSAGVALYDKKTRKVVPFLDGYFNNIQIESMFKGDDKIWFSSLSGIYYWDLKKHEIINNTQYSE